MMITAHASPEPRPTSWDHPFRAQAGFPTGPDDDVIVQGDPEHVAGLPDLPRHVDVRLGRLGIAGRVIVTKDQCRGVQFQRPLHQFARIDRHMIHSAERHLLVRYEAVATVEEEDMEPLDVAPYR